MSLDLSPTAAKTLLVLRDVPGAERVLTPEAIAFLGALHAAFGPQIQAVLRARFARQHGYDSGRLPGYLEETTDIRRGPWSAAPVPAPLADRRVELIGPVTRPEMIAAMSSGARSFVADFDDATAPRFDTMIAGQANLIDLCSGALAEGAPALPDAPVLFVRPRRLHLHEGNIMIDGGPIAAALFDFGLHMFHNARALADAGRGPFLCLAGIENHREARLWNSILGWAQERLELAPGAIRVTVEIDALRAAFEMDEIVWELREVITALIAAPGTYVLSYIRTLRNHAAHVLPDRAELRLDHGFLAHYGARLVKVCHRRGIHALGGVASQLAGPAATLEVLRADKLREVEMGHDGSRVSDPALVAPVRAVFDAHMPEANQIKRPRQYYRIEEQKLLEPHRGAITETGLRDSIATALECLARWLSGRGSAPAGDAPPDMSTAEICRAQLWQWVRHGATVQLDQGGTRTMTAEWFSALLQAEVGTILDRIGGGAFHRGHYASAVRLLSEAVTAEMLPDFIAVPAGDVLNALE
ncbi:malate synthase A [Plastorhodobacter daqingensis]|uniref:malate synthase n=1 Tax=Plastorhodobacter daqingensis TaxID=1387281 RepID=A0ABW2UI51_9RHOB